MLLTRVLVINRVWVLTDYQVFGIGLPQHVATVVGMLVAHLHWMLVMIRAEEKKSALKYDVNIEQIPLLL